MELKTKRPYSPEKFKNTVKTYVYTTIVSPFILVDKLVSLYKEEPAALIFTVGIMTGMVYAFLLVEVLSR